MEIYLVCALVGEYEDKWNCSITAYKNKEDAENHVLLGQRMSEILRYIYLPENRPSWSSPEYESWIDMRDEKVEEFHKNNPLENDGCWPTEDEFPRYYTTTIELVD